MFHKNYVWKSDSYLKTLSSNDVLTFTTQNNTTINKVYDHLWLESLPDNVAFWKECTFEW